MSRGMPGKRTREPVEPTNVWPELLIFLIELMRIRSNLHLFATLTQSETIAHLGSLARASKSVATLVRLLVSPVRELCVDVLQRFVTSRSGFRSNDPFVEHGDERIFANRIQARFTVPFAFYNRKFVLER